MSKIDYQNAREFLKEFKEISKESSTTKMPVYQIINWMTAYASNNETFNKELNQCQQ